MVTYWRTSFQQAKINPSLNQARTLVLTRRFFWYRPSMMGWLLINFSLAAQQLHERGSLSLPMALYQAFTAIYVFDYFWYEEFITST